MTQVLSKENLLSWLSDLMRERVVIAPSSVGELTLFTAIGDVNEIVFEFDNPVVSPKEWFFPRTDTLFTMARKNGRVELIPAVIEKESIIFGLHPCDAKGLTAIDKPFLDPPADALYAQRRAKTALIGLACLKALPQCFCTSLGTAPNNASNLDILLTPVEGGYIVQTVTEKGKALIASAVINESEVKPPAIPEPAPVATDNITEAMRRNFDSEYWSRLAERCIHCNLCAYVCPTCYCFDIRDYSLRDKIERLRTWESCQSAGFTRLAGGYNPRSTKASRLRQRFYHKLLYFPESYGALGCVGCGRCVTACPVNIDIREIITDIQQLARQEVSREVG